MINHSKILYKRYIKYFNNNANPLPTDDVYVIFINEMAYLSKKLSRIIEPHDVLVKTMEKLGYKKDVYKHIKDIKDRIPELSDYEIFSILWGASCRDNETFDQKFYTESIKNNVIYTCLQTLRERHYK